MRTESVRDSPISAGKIERFLDLGFLFVDLLNGRSGNKYCFPPLPYLRPVTAFITRDISETSEFGWRLKAAGWMVYGRLLVDLSPLPFGDVPRADWIFFSSGNAVRFFFEQLGPGHDFPGVRWAALGPSTAKILAEYVGNVDFIGTGEPEETARRFGPSPGLSPGPSPVGRGGGEDTVERSVDTTREDTVGPTREGTVEHSREHTVDSATENETPEHTNTAESTAHTTEESTVSSRPPLPTGERPGEGPVLHLLFPAARNSRQSVMALLSEHYRCTHFEVYDNRVVADPPYVDADVLVFTSPMNAQAYLTKHGLGEKQRVVAIGQTTAKALHELGIAEVEVAATPGERGLAEAVLRLRW
jgi:uroporphyrinogen-III synthase